MATQHLLTRHAAAFAHLYNTRGVPNGSISRQGVRGPQRGPGERQPGSKRWCSVSAHAKSVTAFTHVKLRLSAPATLYNPQTIWLNLGNNWRVSSYRNTPQSRHNTGHLSNRSVLARMCVPKQHVFIESLLANDSKMLSFLVFTFCRWGTQSL